MRSQLVLPALLGVCAASGLYVDLNVSTGSFRILRDGAPWFTSNVTAALRSNGAWLSSNPGGGLPLDGPAAPITGTDPILGPYHGWAMTFGADLFEARIKVFDEVPGIGGPVAPPAAILFEQAFPRGILNASGGTSENSSYDLSSAFPALTLSAPPSGLTYASWAGGTGGGTDWPMFGKVGSWDASGVLPGRFGFMGSVTAVYNASLAACAFSPFDAFMTTQSAVGPSLGAGVLGMGISARVATVPPGFAARFILVAGQGLNDTVTALGSSLLAASGKARVPATLNQDISTRFISYWTDNGAYYYYATEPNKTYQQTVIDAVAYERSIGIPVATLQFDSYWYFKGTHGGITAWEPMPNIFPSGMDPSWVPAPLVLHSRMFDWPSAYSMNYSFEVALTQDMSMPVDANFFYHIMGLALKWGMIEYEQDWLIKVFRGVDAAQSNVTAADIWLGAMDEAAANLGLTIQYCMATPRFLLKSTQIRSVTNVRASPDYHPGGSFSTNSDYPPNWAIGFPSILHFAVGVAPSKDTFWTTPVQTPCHYNDKCTEPDTLLHALVATLSTGPVGVSDRIGSTNATLVHATMRADGLVLKPDVPAGTMDAAFTAAAATSRASPGELVLLDELTAAWSAHGPDRAWRWYYLLAANITQAYSLTPADLGPPLAAVSYIAVDYFSLAGGASAAVQPVSSASPLLVTPGNAQPSPPAGAVPVRYFFLAPVLEPSGWVLVGEGGGKFVPMSGLRSKELVVQLTGFSVVIEFDANGTETELDMLVVAPSSPGAVASVKCPRPASPGATATLACAGDSLAGCSCA